MFPVRGEAFIFIFSDGIKTYLKGNRSVANAPKWTGKKITFRINTDLTALGGGVNVANFTSATLQSAVASAAAAWNSINCKTGLVVEIGSTTTSTFTSADRINTIAFDDRAVGASYCGSVSALACAGSYVLSDTYADCDISVNGSSGVNFGITGSATQYDLVTILVHEMGHCVGLDHTVQSPTYTSTNTYLNNAVMYPSVSIGSQKRSLQQDEKDAMQCVNASSSDASRDPCGSYHGTNGGSAISGVVSGGPSETYTPSCGNENGEEAITVEKGNPAGCVPRAISAESGGVLTSDSSGEGLLSVCVGVGSLWLGTRWLRRKRT